ncbi:MAG: aminotransferase class V-fold PLP-dependent enzyme [Byssovorax sp.]
MSTEPDRLQDLDAFRASYSHFLAPERILLTGHSHQAWPDAARAAMTEAFDDAARFADDKWEEAVFPKIDRVGTKVLDRMGFDPGDAIAFGKSTHELCYRLLSCLKLADRPRIVTTQSEFHSLHRQLSRLAEEGAEVVWVETEPRERLADRLLDALTPGTAMLACSAVLFEDAYVLPRLGEIAARAVEIGAIALVDAYHAFNVVPLAWGPAQDQLFVTAGGYKYAGFGEGVCWLRCPRASALRPLYTGWFADFASLSAERSTKVGYGEGGARFSGATFDPVSFYRADAALAHWDRFGLTPSRLRSISLRQTQRILDRLDAAGRGGQVVTARDPARRGGFVTLRVPGASAIVERLRARSVFVDARRDFLRLGPAPYLRDDELDRGTDLVIEALS